MEADNRQFDGKLFLKDVNRKLNDRLAEIQKVLILELRRQIRD